MLVGCTELTPSLGVPFFAEQSDVFAQFQEPIEQFGGFGLRAGEVQGINEPERAGQVQH
jgi:hypothetical protein